MATPLGPGESYGPLGAEAEAAAAAAEAEEAECTCRMTTTERGGGERTQWRSLVDGV
jgi:hypothetical protein